MIEPTEKERESQKDEVRPEADKPKVYPNPIEYILNVPIETDEELASLGHIYTD